MEPADRMSHQRAAPTRPADPLVLALARLVEALGERYPGGPPDLPSRDLAIRADRANMRAMKRRRPPPAA